MVPSGLVRLWLRRFFLRGNNQATKEEKPEKSISSLAVKVDFKKPDMPELQRQNDAWLMAFGEREYLIRGLEKNQNFEGIKITLRVSSSVGVFVDNLDFYSAKARGHCIQTISKEMATASGDY